MEMFLLACGAVLIIALFFKGHLVPLLVGGVLGSFVGIAGFGGAVSGVIPGALIGALLAVALKK